MARPPRFESATVYVDAEGRLSENFDDHHRSDGDSLATRFVDVEAVRSAGALEDAYTRIDEARQLHGLLKSMARSMPGLSDLRILKLGSDFVLHTFCASEPPVPAYLAGDGFKRLLTLAAAVLGTPKGVVLLEEPESFQHPRYLEELAILERWLERYPGVTCSLTHGFPWRLFLDGDQIRLPEAVWQPFQAGNCHLEVCFPVRLGDLFDFPYREAWPTLALLVQRLGADRLLWGTDMPFQNRFCTYRQSRRWLEHYCDFLSPADLTAIMGGAAGRPASHTAPSVDRVKLRTRSSPLASKGWSVHPPSTEFTDMHRALHPFGMLARVERKGGQTGRPRWPGCHREGSGRERPVWYLARHETDAPEGPATSAAAPRLDHQEKEGNHLCSSQAARCGACTAMRRASPVSKPRSSSLPSLSWRASLRSSC